MLKELKNITRIKEDINDIKNNPPLNNQLIKIINAKDKKILELNQINNQSIIIKEIKTLESLILNDIVITSRSEDNYINATQLCQAGNKKFGHWYSLDITKQLINELASDIEIPISLLIDVKKGNSVEIIQSSWIHPDLAIQLAQWISPKFAIQVSKWIRELFTTGKVELNDTIKLQQNRIKLLENTYLKKHKRENYLENVIYLITTETQLKERTYIIGKASSLKNRLSSYNKTCDHQVIYYKECKNLEEMSIIELMVLNKLDVYREKANRDRFILPTEKNVSFFTDIIDNCINFYANL